ncbi:MAG TPA: hypothetical protein VMX14_01960 [Anaerolineae bacterium]|nr:hypothetical protein [Anaerolineae bacterium]
MSEGLGVPRTLIRAAVWSAGAIDPVVLRCAIVLDATCGAPPRWARSRMVVPDA